ncbi:Pyridine nucleotide-disulfide oxidoreductase domain-containing protein 2 [Nowakowskiella sp. JEL0407]|nr:Pyridine nucleotide-disulfide oxidoreductase domain-containing protein 2 [Nowakowskiella sp. JEL0407]
MKSAIIIGGGHNGLIAAAYLAKSNIKTTVLEKRHIIGGAAVTETISPGFRVSRASYVLSLLRPAIIKDLQLDKFGLTVYPRNPSSFTPIPDRTFSHPQSYLLLGNNSAENYAEISKFSKKDADNFQKYESWLETYATAVSKLLDTPPLEIRQFDRKSSPLRNFRSFLKSNGLSDLKETFYALNHIEISQIPEFVELMTAPASKILRRWFESEPLTCTLATDSVIGAMLGPKSPGSSYVLLHHVMGEINGVRGAWGTVKGGMGAVSNAIAESAKSLGVQIRTNSTIEEILTTSTSSNPKATGVRLKSGEIIKADVILSNATAKITYLDLLDEKTLPPEYVSAVKGISYESATTKINLALSRLPNFQAVPNKGGNVAGPHHQTTIHMGPDTLDSLQKSYEDALCGSPSRNPVIEMTIPSVVDSSLVDVKGTHVIYLKATLFIQYTPYSYFKTEESKLSFANRIFDIIDTRYAPGFKESIVQADILTPPDLEREFSLTGGNIFHGAMGLDSLYFNRPVSVGPSGYRSPIRGLYLCGSGAHPGGGVMGAAGRNAAMTVMNDLN